MPGPRVALASLGNPPDTSVLLPCSEREAKAALIRLRARLEHKSAALEARRARGAPVERVRSALRRLQSADVQAYRAGQKIIFSEPFGAVALAVRPAQPGEARTLVGELVHGEPPAALVGALAPFGQPALTLAVQGRIRIRVVPAGRPFARCSPAVAALVPDIDRWQAPPAGLFVLEERLVLLRTGAMRMAAAHEFGHALDALLATKPRSYYSFEDETVRGAYAAASGFVNEYAASGLDEYFAESLRAYVEVNDDRSCWLPLTRRLLMTRDARMFSIIDDLFKSGRL
jgi:hypothetical protein